MNYSVCWYILEQLIDKKDIKCYFKLIFTDFIEKLTKLHSTEEVTFDYNKIKKKINNNYIIIEKEILDEDIDEQNIDKKELNSFKTKSMENNKKGQNKNKDIFISKYINSLKEKDLQIYLSEYEKIQITKI